MSQPLERFQTLLRELFQFDCADLDFGIYRLMNHKRDAIEGFISDKLPALVEEELQGDAEAAEPAGQEALQATVFNHLYTFFSRYYDEGDFVSKRRYSKRERYMIPYNGEEVHLHWANRDQHYVKTAEHLRNYAFKAADGQVSVRFAVAEANVEQNNVKGERRYFFPRYRQIAWDEAAATVSIPFDFRPMTATEQRRRGKNHVQEAVIADAVAEIPKRLEKAANAERATAALLAERHRNGDGKPISLLEYHLRRYTRRNTSDFFVHKDLHAFLTRELDFYLKNEVLTIAGLEQRDFGMDPRNDPFRPLRAVRRAAEQLIGFFAQVENFQRKLWEKRKFVTEAQYVIRVGTIDRRFYPAIVDCEPQWQEWRESLNISDDFLSVDGANTDKRLNFLRSHDTLPLDTKHFDPSFVDDLLATVDDLDGGTDGLLVCSDNFHALALLEGNYRETVDAVYIDPPYNTFATKIVYKNEYEHSSWLALMESRMRIAHTLVAPHGIVCTTIDDYELHRLAMMMEQVLGAENHLGTVVIRNNPSGRSTVRGFAVNHEYGLFYAKDAEKSAIGRLEHTREQLERYGERDDAGRAFEWENFRKSSAGSFRPDRPKQFFPLYCHVDSLALRLPRLEWQDDEQAWNVLEQHSDDEVVLLPLDGDGSERVWRFGVERTRASLGEMLVRKLNGRLEVYTRKYVQIAGTLPRTWWDKAEYSARDNGTRALKDLFGGEQGFEFPKAPAAVMDAIRVSAPNEDGVVLDYFAGSGTTAQAVIALNREDDRGLRFVLVEVGEYFDAVLVPRTKRLVFAPEWRNGKPQRAPTDDEASRSPRIIKYIRLESYEDALNSLEFTEAGVQQAMQWEEYVVKYMLDFETKYSATLLNFQDLTRPFDYKLVTHHNGNGATLKADVAETFNYLLGLRVSTRKVHYDDDRRYLVYCGDVKGRTTAVIWRATAGWEEADYTRDRKFVAENNLADGADDVYFNGAGTIRGAKPLEPLFHQRLFAPLE